MKHRAFLLVTICFSFNSLLVSQGFVYDGADGLNRYHYHPYNDCAFQVMPGSEDLGKDDPLIVEGPFNEVVGIHPDSTFVYGVRAAILSWWNTSTLEIGQDIFAFGIPAFDDIGAWTDFTIRNDTMYLTARNGHVGVYDLNTGDFQQRIFPNENLGSGITFYKDQLIIGQQRDAFNQLLPKPRYYTLNTDLSGDLDLLGEIELAAAGMPANINSESTFCTAQYHCEDVRVYLEGSGGSTGRAFSYFYPETGEAVYECDIFSDNVSSIGFPEWSSCRLSIDLDLDDEPIQFNRDYALEASCHTELQVVDESLQVFASVGSIDSITVSIRSAEATMRLEGQPTPELRLRGNNTSSLTVVNQGIADFDNYEEVLKSLRFMSDLPGYVGLVEIDFSAYYRGEMGPVSTSRLQIDAGSLTVAQDTMIQVCREAGQIDASVYNDATGGEWLESDSLFVPSLDTSLTTLLYAYDNGCVEDTSRFSFVLPPPPLEEQRDQLICGGDSIQIGAVWYSADTLIVDTLASRLTGCDSLYVRYALDFESAPILTQIDTMLCSGESISINGTTYVDDRTVTDTLQSRGGCDSLYVEYALEFMAVAAVELLDTLLCMGDTLSLGGQAYTEAITILDTLRFVDGCDSLLSELSIRFTDDPILISEQVLLCPGDSVVLGGTIITAAGQHTVTTLYSSVACDSVVRTYEVQMVDMPSVQQEDRAICFGDSLFVSGDWQRVAGLYVDTLESLGGCDSLVIQTQLVIEAEALAEQEDFVLCPGEVVTIAGAQVAGAGVVYDTLRTASGCDSLITAYMVTMSEESLETVAVDFAGQVGDTLGLSLDIEDWQVVEWLDGEGLSCTSCAAPDLVVTEVGLLSYQVVVMSAAGCLDTVLVSVLVEAADELEVEDRYYLPNILSNSTGNDRLYMQARGGSELDYALLVYDRWGNVLFDRVDLPVNVAEQGWAPYESGIAAGVYVYMLQVGEDMEAGTITVVD